MAGGDVDTGLAVVFPNGKAQLRRRAQGIKNAHADAVAHHNFGSGAGKIHAVDAAVHADGDAALFGFLALGGDNIGKALGGMAHDIGIHVMQSNLHGAAQSGSAEFQRAVKTGLNLFGIILDREKLGMLLRSQNIAVEPFFILCHIVACHIVSFLSFDIKSAPSRCGMSIHRREPLLRQTVPGPWRQYAQGDGSASTALSASASASAEDSSDLQ